MSEYGKLWEQVKSIRDEIQRLVPTLDVRDLARVKKFQRGFDALIEQWEQLEKEMSKLKD